MKIGVLALQGAFIEHQNILHKLGQQSFQIRQPADLLQSFDGLILPGGESTVMSKLLTDLQLSAPIIDAVENKIPIFGTCAGLILMAKKIAGEAPPALDLMDITVKRNAFGRQLGSFAVSAAFAGQENIPLIFIRAPYISAIAGSAVALANVNDKIVAVRQEHMLATAFHPELTNDLRIHQYFLEMIRSN